MRESLNLATAYIRIGNGRGAAGVGGRLIGDGHCFPEGASARMKVTASAPSLAVNPTESNIALRMPLTVASG
jgi:hypothetical protein